MLVKTDAELIRSVNNMLEFMGIQKDTKNLVHYEQAKHRWAELCLKHDQYEPGLKHIANWIGV